MSDLELIKAKSKLLYDLVPMNEAVESCNFDGLIISHPYSNTGITFIRHNGIDKSLDIAHNSEDEKLFREFIFKTIDEAENLWRILLIINRPYRLYWFKLIRHFLDEIDYGAFLKEIWTDSENPNGDINVSLNEIIGYFKQAKMQFLMNEDEMEVYNTFPEECTLYRGVSKGRNPNGLSYTFDKEKAIWFQNRFATYENPGFLITKKIKKEQILAIFLDRGESEVVVDTSYKGE